MRIPAVVVLGLLLAVPAAAQQIGPAKGSLGIVGGGALADSGILEPFLDLAGGGEQPLS